MIHQIIFFKKKKQKDLNIAQYYESQAKYSQAGDYYLIYGDYIKAMNLFFQGEDDQIHKCIQVIEKAIKHPDIEQLIRLLHDFLTGEGDGHVKVLFFVCCLLCKFF